MRSTVRWRLFLPLTTALFALSSFAVFSCGSNTSNRSVSGASNGGDGGPTSPAPGTGPMVGQLDAAPSGSLSGTLPQLTNVVATQRDDSVGIDFDPVDNAVDYRVYVLPDPTSVTTNSNGSITIANGVYRCAGLRQTWDVPNNLGNNLNSPDAGQVYFDQVFSWTSIAASAPLGYVYLQATDGAVPVYAVAMYPSPNEEGWREARDKIYTTSSTLRTQLLGEGGRDDGIVFYVPSAASSSTTTVYHSEQKTVVSYEPAPNWAEYYFTSSQLTARAKDSTPPAPAFQVFTSQMAGTAPLLSSYMNPGNSHTELSVGNERFKRATWQGPGPLWHLEWSGITGPTTLVVEALAQGCPFNGFLSPQSVSAPPHQPFLTLPELAQASPTGETYINGQFDVGESQDGGLALMHVGSQSPVPIARSYVLVAPQPHDPTAWDWYEGFSVDAAAPAFTPAPDPTSCNCDTDASRAIPCNSGAGACGYWTSPAINAAAYQVDNPSNVAALAFGPILGQFYDAFDDWAHDVTGSLRFTAPTTATIDSDPSKFLHVTWSVDTVSTDRRYPQMIVTDQASPMEDAFVNPNSNVLLIQPFFGPMMYLEVEAFHGLFNGHPWAVNNQAPAHYLIDYNNWFQDYPSSPEQPNQPTFEAAGVDRMTTYDAFISSTLLYVFMDGTPAGCMQYPSNGYSLTGKPVTVTFGDVLYHEGAADEMVCSQNKPYAFLHEHQCLETKRHWDDLGFKNGVPAPAWNTTLYPCMAY